MIAKVAFPSGERAITYAEVEAYAQKVKATDKVRYPETFEDYVARLLLADEAKKNGATEVDEVARAEAWMQKSITPDAEAAVTDTEMAAAFAERRSAARVMFKTEDEAKALHDELVAPDSAFTKAPDMSAKIIIFKSKNGKNDKVTQRSEDSVIAPAGVLFDPSGKGDSGQAVVPPKIAETAFTLANDGDLSQPFELAPGRWALVMRTGVRPGTPLDKVPPDVRQRMHDGLVASRAVVLMRDRVARLRRDAPVTVVDEAAVAKALGLGRDAMRLSKLRRLPSDRKNRLNAGMRGPRERLPGLTPKDAPKPDMVSPEKVQQGMPQ